jgi:hypothetical protein
MELRSCLKVPGAPRRELPPLSFCTELTVLNPNNSQRKEPLPARPSGKRLKQEGMKPNGESSRGTEDDAEPEVKGPLDGGKVDINKYFTKSIYDSSEEEEPEDEEAVSSQTSEKDPKKKSVKKRFRRKRKTSSSNRLQMHYATKDLDGVIQRLLSSQRGPARPVVVLMEGMIDIQLEGADPQQCRFSLMSNGILDGFSATTNSQFAYWQSFLPIGLSEEEEERETPSGAVWLDYLPCPRSDQCKPDWEAPPLARRQPILLTFASSGNRNKFLSVLAVFLEEGKRPSKLTFRQSSIRNLGRVLKSKPKADTPFPGIALHEAPVERHVRRQGSAPSVDATRVDPFLLSSRSETDVRRPPKKTSKKKKAPKPRIVEDDSDEEVLENSDPL